MPAEQPVIRAAGPADLEPVAAIFAHYVTTTETTFEEVPPTGRGLAAAAGRPGRPGTCRSWWPRPDGTVCGYAYASPWRP